MSINTKNREAQRKTIRQLKMLLVVASLIGAVITIINGSFSLYFNWNTLMNLIN